MAVAQAERAANFIRGQGGVQSVRGARVNRVRARNVRPVNPQEQLVPQRPNVVRQQGSRFGKATGNDYVKFFGTRENTKRLRLAVNNLKNLLVEGFMAAKMLRVSIGNIVKQLKGLGGKGGRGFGLIGIIAAIVVAIGALIGPKIKEAYDFIVTQATEMFNTVKGWLRAADEKIQEVYKNVQGIWDTVRGWIKSTTDTLRSIPMIGNAIPDIDMPGLPDYNGLDFLKDDLPSGNEPSAPGGSPSGGLKGFFGDMLGGITDKAGEIAESLGLPNPFPKRDPNANTGTGRDGTFGEGTYGQGRPSDGANVSAPGDLKTRIRQAESGNDYGSMYARNRDTFSRGNEDITKMTIDQVHDLQTDYLNHQKALGYNSPDGSDRSAAMGAYQMMEVRQVAKDMGFDPSTTLFNKETQDRMAEYYLNVAGLQDYKAGRITAEQFNDQLAVQFASLKKSSGGGAHDGDGMNRAYDSVLDLIKSGDIRGNNIVPQTQSKNVVPQKGTNVSVINAGPQQTASAPRRPQSPVTPAGNTGATPTVAFFAPSNPDASNIYTKHLLGVIG